MEYLVEDSVSLGASGLERGSLWSTSPGLEALVQADQRFSDFSIHNPEALIGHAAYTELWKGVLDHLSDIESLFEDATRDCSDLSYLWTAYGSQVYFDLLMWASKSATMHALRGEVGRDRLVVVGHPELSPVRRVSTAVGRHDHVYAAIAREIGDALPVIEVGAPDPTAFERSFNHVPLFDKVFNIANRSASAVGFQLWNKSPLQSTYGRKGTIVILSPNDLIEESFSALFRSGWRLWNWQRPVDTPLATSTSITAQLETIRSGLKSVWANVTKDFVDAEIAAASWSLMWQRTQEGLRRHASALAVSRSRAWQISQLGTDKKALLVLSNGLYAPEQRLLDACLRELDVPVVCTDHGAGMGLGYRHDSAGRFWANFSDRYIAYNAETKSLYDSVKPRQQQKFVVGGSPHLLRRARFKALQRTAGRRRLGLDHGQRGLMYVTNISINNVPRGYGTATDYTYTQFQNQLLRCLERYDGKVIIKPYPAFRYIDPDSVWTMQHAANTSVAPFGEFRHIRWAADILLTDICSSTLAWAMATDIPMIYVNNASNPLSHRAKERMQRSVFLVDAEQTHWQQQLEETLSKPANEINQEWAAMADSRRDFCEDFIFGPPVRPSDVIVSAINELASATDQSLSTTSAIRSDKANQVQ